MSKKTFQFDAIGKKFEVKCAMPEKDHITNCPIVKMYRAGIDTEVSTSVSDLNKISVRLVESATADTVKTMFNLGHSMCKSCQHHGTPGKKR